MLVKISELSGAALDWAVAKCEGKEINWGKSRLKPYKMHCGQRYSTDWAQGGPIIERERIELVGFHKLDARNGNGKIYQGQNPLTAAMRCYVASKLGDTIEVPDDQIEGEF